jgi:hypothetical protein
MAASTAKPNDQEPMMLPKVTTPLPEPSLTFDDIPASGFPDLGMVRPWRLGLLLVQSEIELIFSLSTALILGREEPTAEEPDRINLQPFGAENAGVSRRHAMIRLDGSGVVLEDQDSINGTRVNGYRLEADKVYAVHHGDKITLGSLELQILMLLNPFE